ncbi:cbb3-type cytochrome c oxidase subunit 3 [Ignatzschineria rhizosphaerae]|uniref:Cbb3-type cytochrome c oxidase subunit 3 n=1 Tax=Ignatzschineria rhizosphaerae TaxID=2923279 RepID=A0ABY3X7Y9_9GAMM|nr:cbb3-type cytochrome c oxidase subunit 3 [Ignatzschineria rhizosphaerae]UNM96870.1 cbb3-type cytochrome c oxidase subunit 3 [Ignatzschineria rhizosphaerae]
MMDFFMWFTDLGNSKTLAAVIFFAVFIGIIIYTFTGKERKKRFDEYRYIPFMDDEEFIFDQKEPAAQKDQKKHEQK